ncbi:MAG: four helix bundle protein [bacterium]
MRSFRGLGYLMDQQRRAMASVVLNLAEGNARRSQTERRRFFEISRASVAEVAACVDLMCAFGLIRQDRNISLKSRLSEVSRMIWGLMR